MGTWDYQPWADDNVGDGEWATLQLLDTSVVDAALRSGFSEADAVSNPVERVSRLWQWVGLVFALGDDLHSTPVDVWEKARDFLAGVASDPGYQGFVDMWKSPQEIRESIRFYANFLADLKPNQGRVHIWRKKREARVKNANGGMGQQLFIVPRGKAFDPAQVRPRYRPTRIGPKPDAGFWTSTLTSSGSSAWERWCDEEGFRSSGARLVFNVSLSAKVFHVTPNTYPLFIQRYALESPLMIDWEAVAGEWDAVHLVKRMGDDPFYAWDVESTVWFNTKHLTEAPCPVRTASLYMSDGAAMALPGNIKDKPYRQLYFALYNAQVAAAQAAKDLRESGDKKSAAEFSWAFNKFQSLAMDYLIAHAEKNKPSIDFNGFRRTLREVQSKVEAAARSLSSPPAAVTDLFGFMGSIEAETAVAERGMKNYIRVDDDLVRGRPVSAPKPSARLTLNTSPKYVRGKQYEALFLEVFNMAQDAAEAAEEVPVNWTAPVLELQRKLQEAFSTYLDSAAKRGEDAPDWNGLKRALDGAKAISWDLYDGLQAEGVAQPQPLSAVGFALNKITRDWEKVKRREPINRKLATNQKIVESPHNFHPVKVEPPRAKRKEFPFEGFIDFQGLEIDVENTKGSERSGVDPDGNAWSVKMLTHYGEIRGTEGTDGDKLDVYVGDNHDSSLVVVVHQHNPWDMTYDEDKVMLGFNSEEEAIGAYKNQYSKPGYYVAGQHTVMPIGQFWRWVKDTRNKGKRVSARRVVALSLRG